MLAPVSICGDRTTPVSKIRRGCVVVSIVKRNRRHA